MEYIAPISGEAVFDFTGVYDIPISGNLDAAFVSGEYFPPVSGNLDADFIGRYNGPISGNLDANFEDQYYVPSISSELVINFSGLDIYVPPISGECVFEFRVSEESDEIGINGFFVIKVVGGTDNHFLIPNPIVDSNIQLLKFNFGIFVEAAQVIMNEVRGRYEGVTSDQILTLSSKFLRGDEAFASNVLLTDMPDTIQGAFGILNLIAFGVQGVEALKLTVTEQELVAIHAIINTIENVDSASGALLLMQSLTSIETAFYNYQTHIFIDGILVDRLVGANTVELSFSQSSVHNEITITSISQELFDLCDPSINPGTPRIEVQIGNRVLFFLLENRNGSDANFTLWGRDQTARDSEPWAESKSIYLTEPTLASEVAASVTEYSAVDWVLYDWVLPGSFEAEGTPVDILGVISQEIGGVLRAQDDGGLLVRPRYATRPVNLSSYSSAIEYFANSVVDFGHEKTTGDHYNCVTVRSQTPDSRLPQIEVESDSTSKIQGDTVFVRVFWTDSSPDIQDAYVSDGTIIEIVGPFEHNTFQSEHTEILEFKDGVAETTYPIFDFDIANIEWIGDTATIAEWNKYGKAISLVETEAFRLAKITYTTEYKRYELSGHDVEKLLAVFYFAEFPALNIFVHTEPIATDELGNLVNKPGDVIETSYLTDQTSAVLRAEAWIDSNKYDEYSHSFKSPYRDNALDGAIIWIDCGRIGSSGNYYITDVGITISGGMVINTLQVMQWQV